MVTFIFIPWMENRVKENLLVFDTDDLKSRHQLQLFQKHTQFY